ncbi:ribonucleoside diphosphate reductase small subunit [Erwinia phage Cronus]|uniref:ribonucleoside-diphosphate reductase n=1 Tax=Erwinia phage Cronus TaxID=2163633 RepID=A0A2S1GLY7_9CAUD|nr:ribonucleoside diphosphate reductase small subunit [Erwinia phage Cronus]AWD90392.1 ribonucleotide reductase, small chain [Erwinia phage Cronus]
MSVFNQNVIDITAQPMFFGEDTGTARFDVYKHKIFEDLTEKQLSFFWRPEEVNVTADRAQYDKLQPFEQRLFTNNLKYQSLLDSIQGRAPGLAFSAICSDVSLETWIQTWTFSETIHSRSYTHIMRNLYDDPSKEFDDIVLNPAIMKRATSISDYYDNLIDSVREYQNAKEHFKSGRFNVDVDGHLEDAMRKLYLCMHVVNALEAIRFYVSFACTFNFLESYGIMEGNVKIMKLIARDEQLHLKGTQYIIRQIQNGGEGELWQKIAQELQEEANQIFLDVAAQEKEWVDDLFSLGEPRGLNTKNMYAYVDYLTHSRMQSAGLDSPFKGQSLKHPLPFMRKFLNSEMVQVAPQEVEISSYLISQIDHDIDQDIHLSFRKYF